MKHFATVKIALPALVTVKLATIGATSKGGDVFVECHELDFTGKDLLYCRYGLSMPDFQFEVGDTVWIEPTIDDDKRFVVTGFADSKTSTELQVLGTTALVELLKHQVAMTTLQTALATWVPVPLDGGLALKTALATFLALPMPDYSAILSLRSYTE